MPRRHALLLLVPLLAALAACVDDYRSVGSARDDLDGNAVNNAPNQEPGDDADPNNADNNAAQNNAANNADPRSCESDEDCSDDQYCFGPSGCDAVWSCQDELPCSAAAPFLACGCDFRFVSLSAGCPDRHGWRADFLPRDYEGSLCDPNDPLTQEEIGFYDLLLRGAGFQVDEGMVVRLRALVNQVPPDAPVQERATSVQDARFEGRFPALGDPTWTAYNVLILFDGDDDSRCDPGERIVLVPIPNPFDLTSREASFTLEAGQSSSFNSTCAFWR